MIETRRIETDLGTWTSSSWEPGPGDALAGSVERIWDFEGTLAYRREQVFPAGTVDLAIQLDDPHRPVEPHAGDAFPALCFEGQRCATTVIEAPRGRCRVVGIALRPLAAFALFAAPLAELCDRNVDFRDIVGPAASDLADRLADRRTSVERVEVARTWLADRLTRARRIDRTVAAIDARIRSDDAAAALAGLAEFEGRSRSRLARRFREQVGLGPKRYARILRFRRALERIAADVPGDSLAAIAAAFGYYDQAHMNAEFRAHAGLSPGAYLRSLRFPGTDHLAHAAHDAEADSFFQERTAHAR